MADKIRKTEVEWRAQLSPDEYHVARENGTERAFTGRYWDHHEAGMYTCVGCGTPLFDASTKFDSGTGWPSFYQPIKEHIDTKNDYTLIWPRTEYHCIRCSGHQGHVFDDGPPPTGQRWCNNGVALNFVPTGDPLPTLRR